MINILLHVSQWPLKYGTVTDQKVLKIFLKEVDHIFYRIEFFNSKENHLEYTDFLLGEAMKSQINILSLPPHLPR